LDSSRHAVQVRRAVKTGLARPEFAEFRSVKAGATLGLRWRTGQRWLPLAAGAIVVVRSVAEVASAGGTHSGHVRSD
jgi:hypothetical protein